MIDISMLLHLLIEILIVGGICWLLWWLVDYVGLPQPFNKVAKVIIAVVAVVFLINVLLGLSGATPLIRIR